MPDKLFALRCEIRLDVKPTRLCKMACIKLECTGECFFSTSTKPKTLTLWGSSSLLPFSVQLDFVRDFKFPTILQAFDI